MLQLTLADAQLNREHFMARVKPLYAVLVSRA